MPPSSPTTEDGPRDKLPEHLHAIWDEIAEQVSPRIGAAGMEALCGQVYRMREAAKRVTLEGEVVADAKGNPCPHPALAIEKQAGAEVRTWIKAYPAAPRRAR